MAGNTVKDMTMNFGKLDKFEGHDFRRWQKKMHFLLMTLKVVYVLTKRMPELLEDAIVEAIRIRANWENDDYICRGHILNGMSDSLFDVYKNVESAKELWDSLESKYMAEDSSNSDNGKGKEVGGPSVNMTEKGKNKHNKQNKGKKRSNENNIGSSSNKKPKLECWKCGKTGHFKRDCLSGNKKNVNASGSRKGSKDHSQDQGQNLVHVWNNFVKYFVSPISEAYYVHVDAIAWWIDSGATTHVCKDHCWFNTYELVEDGSVLYMGDDHFAPVHGKGSVALEFSSRKTITLFNVLYVPKLRKNLIYGPVLNKYGYKQVYESDKYILSKSSVFVGFGYYNNGMFMLNLNKVLDDSESVYMSSSSTVVNSLLWHTRLGHVQYKRMLEMSKDDLILAIDENLKNVLLYVITFIDDAFRFCYVYLLHAKDKALDKFRIYKTEVKLQQNDLIETLRTDRGGEYYDPVFFQFVRIIHETTAPYTPQQNGVAERKNRALKEMVNSMLSYSGLSNDVPSKIFKPRKSKREDPRTYDEGMQSRDTAFWKEAIDDEIGSIMENNTWVLSDLPPGCKPLGCKWIFKRKMKVDGTIDKFKARLVIQGFRPNKGIDYFDTYAPVARITTIRLFLALAAIHNLVMSIRFSMKDMGEANVILGIKIKHENKGIGITQSHYIEKILKKFNREDCSLVSTPMDPVENLKPNSGKPVDQLKYSRAIGCLMYAMTSIRPDIAYAVGRLSRFTSNPSRQHWKAITRVFKYLRGTMNYGLSYVRYPSVLEAYSDASWINHVEDSSSTSG
ncbi:zinc finger, CCHC-type containing protein [Tanacetum coccineum]